MENNNAMIAEFMGAKQIYVEGEESEYELYGILQCIDDGEYDQHFFRPSEMLFQSDWNWLMEVVEKIVDTGKSGGIKYSLFDALGNARREDAYEAVVMFIKWYNQNKN